MKKEAYYFPHYINARNDRKLRRLRKELGVEGYGIYFMLLEVLREEPEFKYPLSDIDLLAEDFGTSEPKVKAVISSYQLFNLSDQEFFLSEKLIEYLQPYFDKSERGKMAAMARWNKNKPDANAMQMHSASNANAMLLINKDNKGNKEKTTNQKNENEDVGWLACWNLYPKKSFMMDARQQWSQLLPTDHQRIIQHLPGFIANHQQNQKMQFLPRLDQYLMKRRWEDGSLPYNDTAPVQEKEYKYF